MRSKNWSNREIEYIKQGMSDLEVMQKTGRSALAVLGKRRRLTAFEEGAERDDVVAPCLLMSQIEKEERIHKLAEKYGVKLLG